ncbi:MAG: PDZ domain-containing protein [Kofleriaceae bacterium]|nr:PDZ domain-containing protein [Kofleriaceae bacterium]
MRGARRRRDRRRRPADRSGRGPGRAARHGPALRRRRAGRAERREHLDHPARRGGAVRLRPVLHRPALALLRLARRAQGAEPGLGRGRVRGRQDPDQRPRRPERGRDPRHPARRPRARGPAGGHRPQERPGGAAARRHAGQAGAAAVRRLVAAAPGRVVLAVGNPFGVGQAVTMGIVSATGRAAMGIVDYEDFIQTDAAINPGNSGGALVNLKGELVGINTAILSRTGGYQGIGFAIPTNMARPIMDALIKDGRVSRGWLGVTLAPLDADAAARARLGAARGVLVAQVGDDTPAARAGFTPGDVILAIDGAEVRDVGRLRNAVAIKGAGQTATFDVHRDGKVKQVKVKLGALPETQPARRVRVR